MKKQEKIREGLITKIKSIRAWGGNPDDPLSPEDDVEDILHYLHSQGVAIKVDKELPNGYAFIKTLRDGGWKSVKPDEIGYVATEPLIKDN